MAEANKNQTAVLRAQKKETIGGRPSRHYCETPTCPTPDQPILIKDLQPVKVVGHGMHFHHKACYQHA